MTISISFKSQPQTIYKAIAEGKVIPDAVEGAKNAKASAAFFNAQGLMKRGVEDQAVKVASNSSKVKNFFGNLKNKAANIKADPAEAFGVNYVKEKGSKGLNFVKDSKIGKSTKKGLNYVKENGSKILSKPAVKKGLKFAGIAALALGVLYLGKKAYDYYKDHKAAPVSTGSVDVKDGDNVWNIAKKDLGGKATNAEIAKRTEELMKLNNLEYANDKGLVIIKPGDKIKLS